MAAKTYPDFGKWLTYQEAIYSPKGAELGIDNTPTQAQYNRMVYTYTHVYAPLCEYFGVKLPVTSFFRCPALNRAVGGSATSEHMAGGAIDINCKRFSNPLTNNQLFEHVRLNRLFDQLIFESPDANNVPGWVHIAIRPTGNRSLVMRMQRTGDGTEYQYWPWPGAATAIASFTGVLLGALAGAYYYFTRNSA